MDASPTPSHHRPLEPAHIAVSLDFAREAAGLDLPDDQWAEFVAVAAGLLPVEFITYDHTDGPPLPTVDELRAEVAAIQANIDAHPQQ